MDSHACHGMRILHACIRTMTDALFLAGRSSKGRRKSSCARDQAKSCVCVTFLVLRVRVFCRHDHAQMHTSGACLGRCLVSSVQLCSVHVSAAKDLPAIKGRAGVHGTVVMSQATFVMLFVDQAPDTIQLVFPSSASLQTIVKPGSLCSNLVSYRELKDTRLP